MGTLGDRIGRRRLLLIGAASFSVASVVAAYSTSAEMLIAGSARCCFLTLAAVAAVVLRQARPEAEALHEQVHDPEAQL